MPKRPWEYKEKLYDSVLVVPAGTKHDSGFMHIAVIGCYIEEKIEKYEICAYPDDISWYFPTIKYPEFEYAQVRTDCYYPQGVMRFHGRGKFTVSEALSSVDVKFIPDKS